MKEQLVQLIWNGVARRVPQGSLLSEVISGEMPCGGRGKCGKCRVLACGDLSPVGESERRHLSQEELARGFRLACMTRVMGDCEVETDGCGAAQILAAGAGMEYAAAPDYEKYGACVDVGTTTLAAKLFDRNGRMMATRACLNPQGFAGADVISRMEASLAGQRKSLQDVVCAAISEMLLEMAQEAGMSAREIDALVITGNTAMLHLLTNTDPEPLSHAPFAARRLFGEELTAESLGLSLLGPGTPVYLPPCISAFVGADLTCALLALGIFGCGGNHLVVDIGTNGEMALLSGGRLTVCSTAAGPAFEGAGISCGMRGETGAIDRVSLVNGALFAHVIGEEKPRGICGSGLVDAAACMLEADLMDAGGCLDSDPTPVAGDVSLTQGDIRSLQLAKSAIAAGITTLLHETGTEPAAVDRFYIAGGFGHYLNLYSAMRIGLLPPGLLPGAKTVGNAALEGAVRLLLDPASRETARAIASAAEVVELAANPFFAEKYMTGMRFAPGG